MTIELPKSRVFAASLVLSLLPLADAANAASPSAEQALKLVPIQKDVDFVRPSAADAAKCTIKAEKNNGRSGWVVRDANGNMLRNFVDTNNDNVVDQWCYYLDGVEVYRDIDSNFNGKADQARWLNTAGMRWGLDQNEDGKIDVWKMISAEEATAEAVSALRDADPLRFSRLLLSPKEMQGLGLSAAKEAELVKSISGATEVFKGIAGKQKLLTPDSKWVYFAGTQPSVLPAGTDGSTADLIIYDDVAAMVSVKGDTKQVAIGTLVKVGDTWRLITSPPSPDADLASTIRKTPIGPARGSENLTNPAVDAPSEEIQKLLQQMEEIDKLSAKAATVEEQAKYNIQRAEILELLMAKANSDQDRGQWQRQFADTVSASVQAGTFPGGIDRMKKLLTALQADPKEAEMVPYVLIRLMTAEYTLSLQAPGAPYEEIQKKWISDLENFVSTYPDTPDAGDAMLQLAIALEFSGEEQKALDRYQQVARKFGDSLSGRKAAGARNRLESVGKSVMIRGKSAGGAIVDLSQFKGKTVLVQYWASWAEPCKTDIPVLKDMLDKYGPNGFVILGISLDHDRGEFENCLREARIKWPQIFEAEGLDGRMATDMGILTVPTMMLIGKDGRVINRGIHAAELDRELRAVIK